MSHLLPTLSLALSFLLGAIVTKNLSIEISKFNKFFYSWALGIILFTAINYFSCVILSFPNGVILAHIETAVFIVLYFFFFKPKFSFSTYIDSLKQERLLVAVLVVITLLLIALF